MVERTHPPQRNTLLCTLLVNIALIFVMPASSLADITVSAQLNTATLHLDQTAQLTITVNGAGSSDIAIPEVDGLTFHQRGQSSRSISVNNQFSSSSTTTYLIQPYKIGSYTIPPITITAGATTLTTDPIPLEVVTTSSAATPRSGPTAVSGNDPAAGEPEKAFIRLGTLPQHNYIGEIVPVKIKAYFRRDQRIRLNSYPSLEGDGFVMGQLNGEPEQSQETLNNISYTVLTWQTTLSAIKEGSHTIRLQLDATRLIPQRRLSTDIFGRRSPFDDDLFDSFFGNYRKKQIKVASQDMELEVRPLPESGKPADFTGAVGDFDLQVSAAPHSVEVGEPLTLTMAISGTGNFNRVEAPLFAESPEWKTYAPSSAFTPSDKLEYSGTKTFEQAIVARRNTIRDIPALSFSYFDPRQERYVTKTSEPIALTLHSKSVPPPQSASAQASEPVQIPRAMPTTPFAGLAPPHLEPGNPVGRLLPLYRTGWFIALIVACLLALAALLGLWLYQKRLADTPQARTRHLRQQLLTHALGKIAAARAQGDSQLFLAECRKAIQQQLGTIWNLEPTAITLADLNHRLTGAAGLKEIFARAEQAAYGGIPLSPGEMDEYYRTVNMELGELQ